MRITDMITQDVFEMTPGFKRLTRCICLIFYQPLPTTSIEYRSDDVIKMKFVKLWDLLRYSERTTSKTPTRQKLAIRAKLSLRY